MQNKVIIAAIWITRITIGFVLLTFAAILGFVIYWHINPEYFDNWYLLNPFKPGSASFNFQRSNTAVGMTFNDLGSTNVYWMMIRTTLFSAIVLFAQRLILKVLYSVGSTATFYVENIRYFKRLAMTGIVFSLVSFFNFGIIDGQWQFFLSIPFVPLLFATACYVMAEIFKEGNRLQEDSNSII